MSVVRVIPIIGRSLNVDRQLAHQFEESFHVAVTPGTSPAQVLQHPNVPRPYAPHPDFPAAFAENVFIEQENLRLYRVDVPYSTILEPGEQRDFAENPLNRRTVIDVRSTTVRELIETDWEGNPLVNTAGDLLVGIEEDEVLWEISVQKNIPPLIPAWFEEYANATNKDPVRVKGRTVKKYQLKITGIDIPDSQFENNVEFIPLALRAVYRKKGWKRVFLNYGLREKKYVWNSETQEYVVAGVGPIIIDGEPVTEPVPLDQNGRAFREVIRTGTDRIVRIKTRVERSDIENNLLKYDTKPLLPFRRLNLFV